MSTAHNTIVPVLAASLGVTFVYACGAYRARHGGAHVIVGRVSPRSTVATIEVLGDVSRSQEIDALVAITEALRGAGYDAHRGPREVRVNWARTMQEAA
ncbi:hypothetical protein WMF01_12275 [Sorangium sp. So ce1667]